MRLRTRDRLHPPAHVPTAEGLLPAYPASTVAAGVLDAPPVPADLEMPRPAWPSP